MNREEFKDKLIEELEKEFPEARLFNDSNSISVIPKGEGIGPRVTIDTLYEGYVKFGFDKALEGVLNAINHAIDNAPDDINIITEYNPDNIYLKVVNYEANEDILSGIPHEKLYDMAICFVVEVGDYSCTITDPLLELYGVSKEEITRVAIENTSKAEPVVTDIRDIIPEGVDQLSIEMNMTEEQTMYVVTGTHYSGSYIALKPVLKKICKEIGLDKERIIIIPSSIYELIVIPYIRADKQYLVDLVKATNMTLDRRDILSDRVYVYDSLRNGLEVIR